MTDWWIQFFKEFQRDGLFNSTTFYHMYENIDGRVLLYSCTCVTQCFNAVEILCGITLDHLCRGNSLHLHTSGTTTE